MLVCEMTTLPTAPISMLSPRARVLLDAVGLEFLMCSGPAYLADEDGRLIWANSAWADFIARLGRLADHPPDRLPWPVSEILSASHVLGAGGGPVVRDDVIELVIGTDRVRSSHWVAAGPNGAVLGFAGTIDQAPLAERARRQLGSVQDRLDDVTRLVSDWLWETGPDLELTIVSARVVEVLGYHPREMVGKTLLEYGDFVDREGEKTASPLGITQPRPFRARAFVMRHANGVVRQFKMSGLPVFDRDTGRFRGYRGTARDVTAETTALGLVWTSRRQLSLAIDSVSDGFALFDAEERLLLFNHRFRELFPKSADRLQPGIGFHEMMRLALDSGDIRPGEVSDRLLGESLAVRADSLTALEYELSDGRWIRATERRTPEGSIVGIRTDITELKRREQALIEAKQIAEHANRAKSEFLANISHELRTPLNAIIGFSELILSEAMGPLGNPQYRDYLGDVLGSGRHLLEIINDIIELAKAEAGRLELNEELAEIGNSIEAVLRAMRERALRGNIQLGAALDPSLPPLRADPRKLRQILMNLVSNALKFTPEGGSVTVRTERADNGDLLLSVIDTGIGIAAQDIATAFKPFGQVDATLSRKYGGTGLGLPLTRAMVELHNGTIGIESTLGEGTMVTVRMPAARLGLDESDQPA